MTDPIEILRQQCKAMIHLCWTQLDQMVDNCCDRLRVAAAAVPPAPAAAASAPAKQLELEDIFDPEEDGQAPRAPLKRGRDEEEHESSGEQDPVSSVSDQSFIDDSPIAEAVHDDDDDDDDFEDDDDDDDDDAPSPPMSNKDKIKTTRAAVAVHYMTPKMRDQWKRPKRAPRRFSPSRGSKAEDEAEEREAEQGAVDIVRRDLGGLDPADVHMWHYVRNRGVRDIQRSPWYCKHFGNKLDAIRSALGRESANNKLPRQIWDDIALNPDGFHLTERSTPSLERCAFCGCHRACTFHFGFGSRWLHMGPHCARLALAWQKFCRLLADAPNQGLADMQAALDDVHKAHARKSEK